MSNTKTKNENLNADNVKNRILQYLYTNVDIGVKHINFTTKDQLDHIKNADYVICPRYSGVRCWVIFMRYKNHRYAVNFPIHSQYKKLNLQVQIYPMEFSVTEDVYAGTIMEGIYFCIDNVRHIIIDEVYLLGGINQLTKLKDYRLSYASEFMKTNILAIPSFRLIMCPVYKTTKEDLTKCYDKLKNNPNIESLTFYPNMYGNKIFTYSIVEADLIQDIICYDVFTMKRSDKPDIYYLDDAESSDSPQNHNSNNDSDSEYKKNIIAYIPDINTSKLCKQWFTKKKKEIRVKCKMDNDNRWIPVEPLE